ncbi:hypothetical protein F5Y14DRAFT_231551 [Nemania sp. NC0429]|nr:hypothetical protein F5Y14DRAFT_231551 [Nemania sp. NC0429]
MKRKTSNRQHSQRALPCKSGSVAADRVVAGGGNWTRGVQSVASSRLCCRRQSRIDRPVECGEREKRGQQIRRGRGRLGTRYGRYHGSRAGLWALRALRGPGMAGFCALWKCGVETTRDSHETYSAQYEGGRVRRGEGEEEAKMGVRGRGGVVFSCVLLLLLLLLLCYLYYSIQQASSMCEAERERKRESESGREVR